MKKKFACGDFAFPLLKHENVLQLIAMMDFDAVDIGLLEGRSHLQPSHEFEHVDKNAKRLLESIHKNGLVAGDVFLQCDTDFAVYAVNQTDGKKREFARNWYLKTLEYANYLECHHVTILPGVEISGDYQSDFDRAVDELSWRVEKAKEYNITLGVEAHVGSLVQQPKQAAELIKKTKGLTLTLDYTHFGRLGVPESEYGTLMPFASHFHARNAAPGQVQTVAKENTIDYDKVVKSMIETKYSGIIAIEFFWFEWENGNRVDNVSETILLKKLIENSWDKYCK